MLDTQRVHPDLPQPVLRQLHLQQLGVRRAVHCKHVRREERLQHQVLLLLHFIQHVNRLEQPRALVGEAH